MQRQGSPERVPSGRSGVTARDVVVAGLRRMHAVFASRSPTRAMSPARRKARSIAKSLRRAGRTRIVMRRGPPIHPEILGRSPRPQSAGLRSCSRS